MFRLVSSLLETVMAFVAIACVIVCLLAIVSWVIDGAFISALGGLVVLAAVCLAADWSIGVLEYRARESYV